MKLDQFRTDMACVIAQKRLTQKEITRLTGVPQPCVSKFLRGEVGISLGAFIALWPIVYDQPFPDLPAVPSLLSNDDHRESKTE